MAIENQLSKLINVDIFKLGRETKNFIGRPFYIDYSKAYLLVSDAWKHRAGGIPQGTFLLAFYDGEPNVSEAILLRVIAPAKLPTDNDVVSSMIEYYKDDMDIAGRAGVEGTQSKLDEFTRYEFSFSGLECRVLGVFYNLTDENGSKLEFGADIENFYSSNNYKVYKATGEILKLIVNQRDGDDIAGNNSEFPIGKVRYSSSRRFQNEKEKDVEVFISPKDFLGKRTALFGMTRTGKSNTVKKIIEATVEISRRAKQELVKVNSPQSSSSEFLEPFEKNGSPKFPVGQIIFDINGEYANPNMQDQGTAIYELYSKDVIRYSVEAKEGFEVLKINFYKDVLSGFSLIKNYFGENKTVDYLNNFLTIDLEEPENNDDEETRRSKTRWARLVACYKCCLYLAGFPTYEKNIKFEGNVNLNKFVKSDGSINPTTGISYQDACEWFKAVWDNYDSKFFEDYKKDKGHEWADEDLKAAMVFLTRKKSPKGAATISGFRKLKNENLTSLHTNVEQEPFENVILQQVRKGKIIIIDLSQGDEVIKRTYSDKICSHLFQNSISRFIKNKPNNFVQFYFEEAHNLFPKKEDSDLSQIYNRIAKEGAKLNLGMIYATQEVSSISSNILKNTQNWFIAHLNNEDELKELRKYYDFSDFTESLVRFSANTDKGFVRMKTYTNPYVVPVQVDRFLANQK